LPTFPEVITSVPALFISFLQVCQMVHIHAKNPNLGIFWRVLKLKMFVYCMTIWIFYSLIVYFVVVWYSLCSFGIVFPFWYVWTKKNLATLNVYGAAFSSFHFLSVRFFCCCHLAGSLLTFVPFFAVAYSQLNV
jgi:hypothetical protein